MKAGAINNIQISHHMTKETAIQLFEEKQVRSVWDADNEKWYFSINDVVGILTDSPNPRKYWSVLKSDSKLREVSWLQTVVN